MVKVENSNNVWTIKLNFPPANGLMPTSIQAILEAVENALIEGARVVILTSNFGRVFSSGADAKWFGKVIATEGIEKFPDAFIGNVTLFRRLCDRIRSADALFIAAINGHCVAGGLELALACDIRFASDENIKFSLPEMSIFGAIPSGGGGTQYLVRTVGASKALELILSGLTLNSKEALEIGLVNRLYPQDELLSKTQQFAESIVATQAAHNIAQAKKAVYEGGSLPLGPAMVMDEEMLLRTANSKQFLAGVASFIEKFGSGK
jgi:enoyl-CoA hydratase